MSKEYLGREIRTHCLRSVGVAPLLTAAVTGDRAVFAPTLERTSLKELRFRMIDIGQIIDLLLVLGHVVQAKQEGGDP